MAIEIVSTTDTPEQVAEAMKAEIVPDEGEETPNPKTDDKPAVTDPEKGKVEGEGDESDKGDEKDDKTDDKPKVAKGATEGEGEEDENDEEDEGEGDQPKPKKISGFKKKFLRAQEENRLLLDLLKKTQNSPAPKTDDKPDAEADSTDTPKTFSGIPEPQLDDFKDDPDPYKAFTIAHSKWSHKEAVAEIEAKTKKSEHETTQITQEVAFRARLDEVRKEGGIYADYDEVLESISGEDLPVTPLMQGLIMSAKTKDGTPISTDIMYLLASHPDRCREIAALPPAEQAAEMGVIRRDAWAESQRRAKEIADRAEKADKKDKKDKSTEVDGKPEVAVTSKPTTTTKPKPKSPPPPITPVGKGKSPVSGNLEDVAASGDHAAYVQRRIAQGWKFR